MLRLFMVIMGLALLPITAWGETRSFRDWTAECDERLSCKALANDSGRKVEMELVRHGHEGASWQLLFHFKGVTPPYVTAVDAIVDGETVQFNTTGFQLYHDKITSGVAGGEELDSLFGKIRRGKELKLAYDSSHTSDRKEPHDLRFSLSGLAAALLWIDEKQKRVGRSKDISYPAGIEGEAETVTSEETKAKLRKLAEPFCSEDEQLEITSYRLPADKILHAIDCIVNPKNSATVFFVETSFGISPLVFADYQDGWTGIGNLPNEKFDAKTGFLQSSSFWGWDETSCMYEGSWVWSDISFKLLEFKRVADCEMGRPEDAKVLYKRPIN